MRTIKQLEDDIVKLREDVKQEEYRQRLEAEKQALENQLPCFTNKIKKMLKRDK